MVKFLIPIPSVWPFAICDQPFPQSPPGPPPGSAGIRPGTPDLGHPPAARRLWTLDLGHWTCPLNPSSPISKNNPAQPRTPRSPDFGPWTLGFGHPLPYPAQRLSQTSPNTKLAIGFIDPVGDNSDIRAIGVIGFIVPGFQKL